MGVAFFVKEYDPGLLLVITGALYGSASLWEIRKVQGHYLHTWLCMLREGVINMSSMCIEEARWS